MKLRLPEGAVLQGDARVGSHIVRDPSKRKFHLVTAQAQARAKNLKFLFFHDLWVIRRVVQEIMLEWLSPGKSGRKEERKEE